MKELHLFFIAIVLLHANTVLGEERSVRQTAGLRCRMCTRDEYFEDCDTVAICDTNEVCYMESIITDDGRKIYEGGCRAKDVCSSANANLVGKRDELIACSRCCDTDDLCNELLCGLPYRSYDALHCNSCGPEDHIRWPEDCYRQSICQSDEMCFSYTVANADDTLTHVSGCRRAAECRLLALGVFVSADAQEAARQNRGLRYCDICCGDTMCNLYTCDMTKSRLLSLRKERRLNETTLKELVHPYPANF